MKNIIGSLFAILILGATFAEAQIVMVQELEFPEGYEAWESEKDTLNLRSDLVIESEIRAIVTDNTEGYGEAFIAVRLNGEITFARYIELSDKGLFISLYFITEEGFQTIRADLDQPPINDLESARQDWDKLMREKYDINDEEMRKIESYGQL